MKSIKIFCALAVLSAFFIMPPGNVQAADGVKPLIDLPEDPLDWHCAEADPGACPADGEGPWGYTGTSHDFNDLILGGKIVCTGWGCSAKDVYVQVDWTFSWSSSWVRVPHVDLKTYGWNSGLTHTQQIDCDPGKTGTCVGHFYYLLPASELSSDPSATKHVTVRMDSGGMGTGDTVTKTFTVQLSGMPISIEACDDEYQASNCELEELDPTDDEGHEFTTVIGQMYRLSVQGGPWYSSEGGPEQYGTEFSYDDGVTWNSNDDCYPENVACIQNDIDNTGLFTYFFEATSTSLKIRVKDDVDSNYANNVGSIEVAVCEAEEIGESNECAGQFTVGTDVVASGTINANSVYHRTSASGLYDWITPGDWYVLTTTGGSWQNGGVPPALYDIEMSDSNVTWYTPDNYPNSNCQTEGGNYISVYFQGSSTKMMYLRVDDDGLVFNDNTGSITYTITAVDEYNPFSTGCSLPFDINNFVESREALATNGAGITLMETSNFQWPVFPFLGDVEGSKPKMVRYLVLETFGYWYNNGVMDVDGEMKQDDDEWQEISIWDQADCVETIDPLGHDRVFFDANADRTWKFRVNDSGDGLLGFINNSGRLGYDLYWAVNYTIPTTIGPTIPPAGTCDDYYSYEEDAGIEITLNGTNSGGVLLPYLEADEIVAIQISEGPWENNGVDSYAVGISDDNGVTYENIATYDGTVCKEQSPDSDHPLLYVRGRSGHTYRSRVFDEGLLFSDNSQSITLIVYPAAAGSIINPWHSCATNYDLTEVPLTDDQRFVSGAIEDGIQIPSIESGETYAVEITGENAGWGLGYYTAEMNNGSGWVDMPEADWVECAVAITNEDDPGQDRYRVYFDAENGVNYRIRVNAAVFPTIGGVYYRLYSTEEHTSLPPNYIPPVPPFTVNPLGGCSLVCTQPGSIFTNVSFSLGSITFGSLGTVDFPSITLPTPNVGDWIDYIRCSLITYVAWCDSHTAALGSIFTILTAREPFGTLDELSDGYSVVQNGLEGIIDSGGEEDPNDLTPESAIWGGATGGQSFEGLIPNLREDNPLFGGEFNFSGSNTSGDVADEVLAFYRADCMTAMEPKIGDAAGMFCDFMKLLHKHWWGTYVLAAIQVALDLVVLLGFIAYIQDKWIGKGVPA